jgi:tetratricopeptide (TPR) repeat protein
MPAPLLPSLRVTALLLGCLLLACGSKGPETPGGADPERMSDSEYEIAKDLWLRQDHPREALQHALKATELKDDNADAQHLVGLIYLDFCRRSPPECRLKEAEAAVRKAIEARSDYREAKNTLGVVLIHEKRYADAIGVLEPLTADILYTTPENAWGNLGWAYLEKGDLEKAVAALERSVAAQPLFCVGNYRLGEAYEKKGQYSTALEAYTRALETDQPACRALQEGYLGRGRVLERLGRAADAKADLEHCRDLDASTETGKDCRSMLAKLK